MGVENGAKAWKTMQGAENNARHEKRCKAQKTMQGTENGARRGKQCKARKTVQGVENGARRGNRCKARCKAKTGIRQHAWGYQYAYEAIKRGNRRTKQDQHFLKMNSKPTASVGRRQQRRPMLDAAIAGVQQLLEADSMQLLENDAF